VGNDQLVRPLGDALTRGLDNRDRIDARRKRDLGMDAIARAKRSVPVEQGLPRSDREVRTVGGQSEALAQENVSPLDVCSR
jgi:hypothetical protein